MTPTSSSRTTRKPTSATPTCSHIRGHEALRRLSLLAREERHRRSRRLGTFETQTAAPITSTAYYYVDARRRGAGGAAVGADGRKATRSDALADSIGRAFEAKFYHADTGLYDNGSQTALSCALYQGLVEPQNREQVLNRLVAAVEHGKPPRHRDSRRQIPARDALLEGGRAHVAYRIIHQPDQPGWIWWRRTTLWEQWTGAESRNHIMFGDVSAWFYKALGGIRPESGLAGLQTFRAEAERSSAT